MKKLKVNLKAVLFAVLFASISFVLFCPNEFKYIVGYRANEAKNNFQTFSKVPNNIDATIGDTLVLVDIARSENADTLIFAVK